MELLRNRFGPFLVCLVLVVAGCAVWRQAGLGQAFRFNHKVMLHQSVECADCHVEPAVVGGKVGYPALDTCLDCHDTIDKQQPPSRQVRSMFDDQGAFTSAQVCALSPEIIFSHKAHSVDHKVACADCHQGIKDNTAIDKSVRVDMKACVECHAKTPKFAADPNHCATCHQSIRKDAPPPSHAQNWRRFHGQTAKDGDREGVNQCSLCHTQDSCNSCHRTEAPANHTNHWCQRGHGQAASLDRDTCATCHTSDFCVNCHKTTAPRSHRGQWGEPMDKHCVNCHVPVSGERCAVCHQQGTPSHAKASRTPASMIGTNCRACHGVTPNAKLPHVDNGDDCNYCHH